MRTKSNNISYRNNFALIFLLTIVILFFQLSTIGYNIILEYIGLILIILISLNVPKTTFLGIVMFLLPSNQYINLGGTSIITILITLYFVKLVFVKREKINIYQFGGALIFLVYSTIYGQIGAINHAIKICIFLFFSVSLFRDGKLMTKDRYIVSIKYLSLGITLASLITIIFNPQMTSYRFSLTAEQSTNTLGMLSVFTLANLVMMSQNKHFKLSRKWSYMIIPVLIIGFMTQSRMFVIGLLIVIVWALVFMFSRYNNKSKIVKLIMFGLVAFILLYALNDSFKEIVSSAIDRILNPRQDDITGGRTQIWSQYLREITNNWTILLFGAGYNISPHIHMMPHNLYIEQIYYFGMIGNILILALFLITIKIIFKRESGLKFSLYGFLPVFIIVSMSFFTHSFIGGGDMVRFLLAIVASGLYREPFKENAIRNYCS